MNDDMESIVSIITNHYLKSNDFNGLPVYDFAEVTSYKYVNSIDLLRELIKNDVINVADSKTDENPHIIRYGFEPIEMQLEKITKLPDNHLCFYPSAKYLENVIDKFEFNTQPYTLLLALGNAQLSYKSFELSVLERFRNDPRYYYTNSDIGGSIFYNEGNAPNDKTMLETFGFSYNEKFDRAVAVFIRYLADQKPEQQAYWKSFEFEEEYHLHPGYYNNSIGNWPEKQPICEAILDEIEIINKMCILMNRPPLFNSAFSGNARPKNFSFLIRPTLKEYNDFILVFDKILSDNINKKIFLNEVEYELIDPLGQKIQKGTISLLEEWFNKYFRTSDRKPLDDAFKTIKEIRKLRQKPAHIIQIDIFDQKYFHEQRQLIIRGYEAVRIIRQCLYNHPLVREKVDIPDWLWEGKIWDF